VVEKIENGGSSAQVMGEVTIQGVDADDAKEKIL